MSRPVRLALFAVAGAGLAAVLLVGFHHLPHFGHAHELYGARGQPDRADAPSRHRRCHRAQLRHPRLRHPGRGVHPLRLGFRRRPASAPAARRERSRTPRRPGIEEHRFAGASEGLKLASLVLIPLLIALGAYLVFHGQLTPGGGFQGGVVLAAGPIAILLAGRYLSMKRVAPKRHGRVRRCHRSHRLRADRARWTDHRRHIPEGLRAPGIRGSPALGRDHAAQQRRRGPRGRGRLPAHLDRVPRPDDDRTAERIRGLGA